MVGINDYYQQPGVKHPNSLHGCVNDALSVRELLTNRFGFAKDNIYTLFDSAATRTAVLSLMFGVLKRAAPGDAFVFFYSGHGVWMKNAFQLDSVKRKMSQAMAMSNLYAPDLGCLMTDEDLKTVFNQFVDKKVIATALLDCCYSGFLIAPPAVPKYWWPRMITVPEKAIHLDEISYLSQRQKPKGCPVDSAGGSLADTDGDGVPDCRDWEPATPPGAPVDSLGVASAEDYIEHTTTDPRFAGYSLDPATAATQKKAFNLEDELTVNYLPRAARPADREGSGFLSLAAARDYQKAAEITDETGMRHGAFTKALLAVYKNNPSALPVSALIDKIAAAFKQQQNGQTPTCLIEKSRLKGNLTGVGNQGLSDAITAACTAVNNGRAVLDKGLYAGITKGNVLKRLDGKKTIVVDSATATESMATDSSGTVRRGEVFRLIDNYTASAPLLKFYIPEAPFTTDGFAAFLKNKIEPLIARTGFYADYYFPTQGLPQTLWIYTNATARTEQNSRPISKGRDVADTVILLPLPSYITSELKKKVAQNQNIKLVNNAAEADYVLYLNYTKARANKPSEFVFFYHPPLAKEPQPVFSASKFSAPTLALHQKGLQALCEELYGFTQKTLYDEMLGGHWLNGEKRRGCFARSAGKTVRDGKFFCRKTSCRK